MGGELVDGKAWLGLGFVGDLVLELLACSQQLLVDAHAGHFQGVGKRVGTGVVAVAALAAHQAVAGLAADASQPLFLLKLCLSDLAGCLDQFLLLLILLLLLIFLAAVNYYSLLLGGSSGRLLLSAAAAAAVAAALLLLGDAVDGCCLLLLWLWCSSRSS